MVLISRERETVLGLNISTSSFRPCSQSSCCAGSARKRESTKMPRRDKTLSTSADFLCCFSPEHWTRSMDGSNAMEIQEVGWSYNSESARHCRSSTKQAWEWRGQDMTGICTVATVLLPIFATEVCTVGGTVSFYSSGRSQRRIGEYGNFHTRKLHKINKAFLSRFQAQLFFAHIRLLLSRTIAKRAVEQQKSLWGNICAKKNNASICV